MIKIFYGKKGMGKTKILVDTANKLVASNTGDVVFIDDSNQLMYDLKHEIRFINVSEFPVNSMNGFLGFLCGIISEDYDINNIFIDGLNYILKEKTDSLGEFFNHLKQVAQKYSIQFYISMSGDPEALPECIQEFVA